MGKFRGAEDFTFSGDIFKDADSITIGTDSMVVNYNGNVYTFSGSFALDTSSDTTEIESDSEDEDEGEDESDDDLSDSSDDDGHGEHGDDDQAFQGVITGIQVTRGTVTLFKAEGLSIDFRKFDDMANKHDDHGTRKLLWSGDDSVHGSSGHDKLEGHDGDDDLEGGSGNDDLFGGNGHDVLDGGKGNDDLEGEKGSDDLTGGAGTDSLDGGAGNDDVTGGAGNDVVDGGAGADLMLGGRGADTFEFDSLKDFAKGRQADTIGDFGSRDKIDVSDLDANSSRSGNQAFDFIDDARFTKHAGEIRVVGNDLYGDTNGDGKADFHIEFDVSVHLNDDSFIL